MSKSSKYKKSVKRIKDDQRELQNPRLKRKVLRFGKYKNYEFNSIPLDYLKWAILNINDDHTLDDLIRELQRRDSFYIV